MGRGEHGGHCHSHDHHHGHAHSTEKTTCSKTLKLGIMMAMIFVFFLVEAITGQITHSISLIADSFHMLSDFIALCIGMVSVRLSKRESSKNTFGWVRAEILGALVNSVFLVSLCISMAVEALEHIILQEHGIENVDLLLYTACVGLFINIIGLAIFGHGHTHSVPSEAVEMLEELQDIELGATTQLTDGETPAVQVTLIESSKKPIKRKCCSILSKNTNLNIRAVFLHVLADALGSVVVIISALINKFSSQIGIPRHIIHYVDPVLCLCLVSLILASTIPLFKQTAMILLQTVPASIELNNLKDQIKNVNGVVEVNNLHVWNLSPDKIIASVHITCNNINEYMDIANRVKEIFHKNGIHSSTIQPNVVNVSTLPQS